MNIEQILALPLAETFIVEGRAENVQAAHVMAYNGLIGKLGTDPPEAWHLKVMTHTWASEDAVTFHAEFVRRPETEDE